MGGAFQDAPPIRTLNGGAFGMRPYHMWYAPLNIYYRKQKKSFTENRPKYRKDYINGITKKYYINRSITEKHYMHVFRSIEYKENYSKWNKRKTL